MLQTSNLAVLMRYSFLVLTKCQVFNLRVGRSRDQVLQRAHSKMNTKPSLHKPWLSLLNVTEAHLCTGTTHGDLN